MKWSLILSILIIFMFFASYSKSDFGRKIAQHFYFQTTFIVVLIIVFVSKIIHLRLNLISMISFGTCLGVVFFLMRSLISFLCSFGGLSIIAQTTSFFYKENISIPKYFFTKLLKIFKKKQ